MTMRADDWGANLGLTFATTTSIPVQLGKWIALHEAFGTRQRESYSYPKDPKGGEPKLCVCEPIRLQLLEGGALRVVFKVYKDVFPSMKPWMEVDIERGVLATTNIPDFACMSDGMGGGPHPVPDCAWFLAEILLTVLDKFITVGARDPGTLQDLFWHYFASDQYDRRRGWDDNYGPLPGSRKLNEVQFASILQLSDQYRAKFGSDAAPCKFAYHYGEGRNDALHCVRSLAALATALPPAPAPPVIPPPVPSLLAARVRELEAQEKAAPANQDRCNAILRQELERKERIKQGNEWSEVEQRWVPAPQRQPPSPPPQQPPPPPPPPSENTRGQLMQREEIQLVSGNKQAMMGVPPLATECMAFTCATVEDVPVMVAKLMAVCSSETIGHGKVRPFELQLLQHKTEVVTARVLMHVHRMVADEVRKVPDWARPYPAVDDRPGLIQLRARLPDWDDGGIAAPLAHSVHLAELLHAWFERCLKNTTKRCRKFLDLVTGQHSPENLMLTEEQQHILLELSEEYLALHRNGWRKEPKDPGERRDSPTNVEATEFPKLGDSPTQDASGRTTYFKSMFAISKPVTRKNDFEKLWTVAWLGPNRKDRIWLNGPKACPQRHIVLPPDHARISCQNNSRRAVASW